MPEQAVTRRKALFTAAAGVVLGGCTGGLENAPSRLRIATGPPGAVYREIGSALAAVLEQRLEHTNVETIPTDASLENLELLAANRTDLAMAQLDATMAGLSSGVPDETSAVARLYDNWLHLVVRADSAVHEVSDLGGRRVAVGAPGSGTQFMTARLLGLLPDLRAEPVNMTQEQEADALRTGRIDAFFTSTGLPTPAVSELMSRVPIRLVSLAGFAERLNRKYGGAYPSYRSATVPASAYPGIPPTETVTVPNLLLVRPGLAGDLVEMVTDTLYGQRARIARVHPAARSINVRSGIATGPVPLHPGARAYYRERKR